MTDKPKKKSGGRRHKAKGDAFEREIAAYLNETVFPPSNPPQVHRTPLSGSFSPIKGVGSADLTGTTGIWVEAKRVEKLNFHEAMAQARKGTLAFNKADKPIVVNRRNNQAIGDSLVVLSLDDFAEMYKAWLKQGGHRVRELEVESKQDQINQLTMF